MSKRKAEAVVELEGRKFPSDSDINEPDKWGLTLVNPSKWKEAQDTDPLVTLQSLSFHCYSFSASWTSEMLRLKVTFICPTYIVQLALSHQSTTNIVQEDGWRTLKFSRSIKKKKKRRLQFIFLLILSSKKFIPQLNFSDVVWDWNRQEGGNSFTMLFPKWGSDLWAVEPAWLPLPMRICLYWQLWAAQE